MLSSSSRRMYEPQVNKLRSLSAGIEAPVQLVLVLYLMTRGLITLPWQESVTTSCLEDSFGRVACLPSLPLASLTFSVIAIVKATFDLNIYPLTVTTTKSYKIALTKMLDYFLLFFTNTIFRLVSYSIILVFLDNWALIPLIIIWTINLIIRSSYNVSKIINSFHNNCQRPVLMIEDADDNKQKKTVKMERVDSEHYRDNFSINNYNYNYDSVLLDTTIGIFLPCFHIDYLRQYSINQQKMLHLEQKMKNFFRTQIVVTNLIILTLLIVIFYFVIIDEHFNYNSNIMDPITFIFVLGSLIYLGIVGIVVAQRLTLKRAVYVYNSKGKKCEEKTTYLFSRVYIFRMPT